MSFIFFALVIIFPLWKIYEKVGINPFLSLLVFVPFVGISIVLIILAFSKWSST